MTDPQVVPATSVELEFALCPPWLLGTADSIKFPFVWSLVVDGSLDWIRLGMLQQMPTSPVTQPEAVAALGRDAEIARGRFEPQDSYAGRVKSARSTWALAGNARTLLRQLRAYFLPDPPLIRYLVNGTVNGVQFADWTTINPDGTIEYLRASPNNWDWDGKVGTTVTDAVGTHSTLVRFWVFIYKPALVIKWGATPVGSGLDWGVSQDVASWGFDGSDQWYVDVRNLIVQWKAAGSHCGANYPVCDGGIVAVIGDPVTTFNPTNPPDPTGVNMPNGTWGNPSNRNSALGTYLGGI